VVFLLSSLLSPISCSIFGRVAAKNRGDRRWTFPNDLSVSPLLWLSLPQPVRFTENMFFEVGKA
jgi:hypothetical protein